MSKNSVIHQRKSANREVIVETLHSADQSRKTFRINKYQKPSNGYRMVSLPPEYESDEDKAIERANEWVE
jgi:hypothetical protein